MHFLILYIFTALHGYSLSLTPRVSLDSEFRSAILRIRSCVSQFGYRMRSYSGTPLKRGTHDFESIVSHLSLADLNRALFRCDSEERDEGKGRGAYGLPGYGDLVYCGLQGKTIIIQTDYFDSFKVSNI